MHCLCNVIVHKCFEYCFMLNHKDTIARATIICYGFRDCRRHTLSLTRSSPIPILYKSVKPSTILNCSIPSFSCLLIVWQSQSKVNSCMFITEEVAQVASSPVFETSLLDGFVFPPHLLSVMVHLSHTARVHLSHTLVVHLLHTVVVHLLHTIPLYIHKDCPLFNSLNTSCLLSASPCVVLCAHWQLLPLENLYCGILLPQWAQCGSVCCFKRLLWVQACRGQAVWGLCIMQQLLGAEHILPFKGRVHSAPMSFGSKWKRPSRQRFQWYCSLK